MTSIDVAARLGIRHPIVQGPFGGNLSTPQLVAAVSNLGGLGSFGAHVLSGQGITDVARDIRARTSAPFALNLWISSADPGGLDFDRAAFDRAAASFAPLFEALGEPLPAPPEPSEMGPRFADQIDALLEARPAVFSFVFGIPAPKILEACRARGIVTVGAATSLAEARALKDAGVDVVVATGFEAGGHRPSFLASAESSLMGTFALTQLVSRHVDIGVIAAGGIVDERGVRAARALGAHAVQVGTAFLACEESGATAQHRALLLSARAESTTLTRSFSGRLARGLTNDFTARTAQLPSAPYPLQLWLAQRLKRALLERELETTELSSLWGSQAAPNLRHRTAAAVMGSLLSGL